MTRPKVSIRPAIAGDAGRAAELVAAAYGMYVERMDRIPAPILANYEELIGSGVVTIAETPDQIAGLIVCYPRNDALHVENVAVDPTCQGHGIGHALMDFAEEHAKSKDVARVELYTNEVMVENIPFYEKRGYVITGRGLEDGYERIFFVKEL